MSLVKYLYEVTKLNIEKLEIRITNQNDFNDIMEVEEQAFGSVDEAKLTADLLSDKTAEPNLSLLAFYDGEAVGHILFTRAYIGQKHSTPVTHILAPLAVKPKFQKMGIGGKLIKEGIKILKDRGTEIVFVLGHIEYYPKHGFIPDANSLGFPAPYPIPEEVKDAWMVQPLGDTDLKLFSGNVICAEMMDKPECWRE